MHTPHNRSLKDSRVAQFAASELMLDILYAATSSFEQKLDLEAIWIVACVLHNTMREAISNPEVDLSAPLLPESVRLSMSRRAIADKTGLSRETVRRRTNKLIEEGILEADPNGNVKLSQTRDLTVKINSLNQTQAAVGNYLKRVTDHDVQYPLQAPYKKG